MSQRYKGAIISATPPTTSTSSASGEWTLAQQAQAQGASAWPVANPDPYFNQVSLLLHGDGTNGGQNNTFLDSSPPGGYSDYCSGSDTYISFSTPAGIALAGDFTLEAWVYKTATASGYTVFARDSGAQIQFTIDQTTPGSIGLYAYGSVIAPAGTAVTNNVWHHVAWVRSGSTVTAYVDGVSKGSGTYSGTMYIGYRLFSYDSSATYALFGYVSNLRVTSTAVYTTNFTPTYGNLTAITGTQLLTCQGTSIVDASPNAYTISNSGLTVASPVTITRAGNTTQGTFSPFSQAAGYWSNYFNGSTDYLTAPANSLNFMHQGGTWTFEFLFYTSSTGYQTIASTAATVLNTGFTISISDWSTRDIGIEIYAGSGSGYFTAYTATNVWNTGVWNHVAIIYTSGVGASIYLNGVSKSLTTSNTLTGFSSGSATYVPAIGRYQASSPSAYFTGYISNVRAVNGTAVYTSNFTPPTSPLTAITNTSLLTCQSNRFVDNSANNFTITPSGDTKVTAWSPFQPALTPYSTSTNGGSGYFDGNGDYLSCGTVTLGTGDYTCEGWFYSTVDEKGIFSINQSSLSSIGLLLRSSFSGGYQVFFNGSYTNVTATLPYNQWVHFALVRSSGTFKFYINGVSLLTSTDSVNYPSYTIYAGFGYSSGYALNGYLSNFRVTTSAVYTANFTPPTAPLTAITNTQLLLNCTNAGIYDNAIKNDVETVGNAQISTSVKKYGTGSMYFDGTGDYLRTVDPLIGNFGSGAFTVECWFNLAVSTTQQCIASNYQDASNGWSLQYHSNVIKANLSGDGFDITGTTTINTGTWYHIALSGTSGTGIKLFVNGVQEGSTYTGATALNSTLPVSIGTLYPYGSTVNGYIDDLRITKGVARYTANFVPPIQAFPDY